ncbi:MAG: hypothetical protein ACI9CE_002801 [Flavobacterium sp.]|jgi:hypothetical protein
MTLLRQIMLVVLAIFLLLSIWHQVFTHCI